ncbi:phenylalanine--tRNA ligase subunit beta, partial [Buchnera aphidicola]|nr:phenylalanine--tRNA ligase subunit beta [Buchnera aphidicola]
DLSRSILINRGYYEIITYGFIDPKIHYTFFPKICPLVISNPISQEMSCMRFSLCPGLLKTVSYNKNRQINSMRFFEIGLCFKPDKYELLGVKQDIFLGAVVSGDFLSESWYSIKRKIDFYDLKGDLESILDQICGLHHIQFKKKCMFGFHPEQSAEIYFNNQSIGYIGAIDPRLEKKLDVSPETFVFEISLKNIKWVNTYDIQEISKFPSSRRDISILISQDVPVSDVIKTFQNIFMDKRVEINLFDVYPYQGVNSNYKSVGISIIFEDLQKTLIDNEINLMMDNCIGVLKKKFQAILRK